VEEVLDLYSQPYDPQAPVVCFDEHPVQLISEVRSPPATGTRKSPTTLWLRIPLIHQIRQRKIVDPERKEKEATNLGVDWQRCIPWVGDRQPTHISVFLQP